jgi:hypothetical protein
MNTSLHVQGTERGAQTMEWSDLVADVEDLILSKLSLVDLAWASSTCKDF